MRSPTGAGSGNLARVDASARRGIVFIAWIDNDDDPGFYSGYWDGGGRGPHEGFLGQMPETSSVETALEMGSSAGARRQDSTEVDPAGYCPAGADTEPGMPRLDRPDREL